MYYACLCLNIQISLHLPPSHSAPPSPSDPDYELVYVGQEGISIVHPQLTLRSRTHSKPLSDSESLLRTHTSLTCLICRLLVYRVIQFIPPDMDATEGPVLPTEDWVEHQVLQSGSGWVELAKQCLTDESVTLLRASEAYSPVFRVVLPTRLEPSPLPPISLSISEPSSPHSPQSGHPFKVLPSLSPLFPPPPFTPSHPAFDHLAAVALQRSEQLRKDAEDHLSQIMRARVLEIEKEEEELRHQVQLLWAAFREAESVLMQETKSQSPSKRLTETDSTATTSVSHANLSPVAINDFVPVSTLRLPSPDHDPYPSALSTSLAASSFHHPSNSAQGTRSTSPNAATLSSPLPTSSTLVGSINYRDPVRRDMNEDKDIATSYKYVVDLEAERSARARQYQSLSNVTPSRANMKLATNSNPVVSDGARRHSEPTAGPSTSQNKTYSEEPLSPSGSKGKRKVTFDIMPVIPGGEEAEVDAQGEASVFELEDDNSDTSQRDGFDGLTLTFRDPIDGPSRPHRQPRVGGGTTLPQSLQMLRPASLPATVALRASDVTQPESPSRKNVAPPPANDDVESDDEPLSPRDQELARLVNVTTPSHRNAWKTDRQSWKLFGLTSAGDTSLDSPDTETDAIAVSHAIEPNGKHAPFNAGVSASLPISIALTQRDHTEDESLDETDAKAEPTLPSASYRKASYAARDRSRLLDPGALDFEAGDDESLDADDGDTGSLSRGRRRALKILQARSELPAEGMWRSLAT